MVDVYFIDFIYLVIDRQQTDSEYIHLPTEPTEIDGKIKKEISGYDDVVVHKDIEDKAMLRKVLMDRQLDRRNGMAKPSVHWSGKFFSLFKYRC